MKSLTIGKTVLIISKKEVTECYGQCDYFIFAAIIDFTLRP